MSDFNQEIHQEMAALIEQINKELRNGVLYGWNLVTTATPVETGMARASWFVSVDVLPSNSKPKVKGKKRVYQDPPTPDFTIDIKTQHYLFIANNVNYIEYLEYGTPKIEAFAIVKSALPKINRKLESTFKKIKGIR